MKQSTNTETVNESLTNITPGEWIVTHDNRWPMTWAIRTKEWHIANLNPFSPEQENAKANAEIICKAVNERQSLLDSNREMKNALLDEIEVLKWARHEFREGTRQYDIIDGRIDKIETLLNNL